MSLDTSNSRQQALNCFGQPWILPLATGSINGADRMAVTGWYPIIFASYPLSIDLSDSVEYGISLSDSVEYTISLSNSTEYTITLTESAGGA